MTSATHPVLPADALAVAAARLSPAELGALVRIALAIKHGAPATLRRLARNTGLPDDLCFAVTPWFEVDRSTGCALRVVIPRETKEPRRTSGRRQAALPGFDEMLGKASAAHAGKGDAADLQAWIIRSAIAIWGRAGLSEQQARRFVGGLLKDFTLGVVAEAVEAARRGGDGLAAPEPYIRACIKRLTSGAAPIAQKTGSVSAGSAKRGFASGPTPRPLATPSFLGISDKTAEMIRAHNKALNERIQRRF